MLQNFFATPAVLSVGLRADLAHADAVPVSVARENNFVAVKFHVKQRARQRKFSAQVVARDLDGFFRADNLRGLDATGRSSVVRALADSQLAQLD